MTIRYPSDSSKIRILLVDDEQVVLDSLREVLLLEGYSVETASDGQEGFRILQKSSSGFDLILTDLVMHPLGGIELLEKARFLDPDIIVILMTGYATIESAVAAIRKGAYDFLLKPFHIPDLKLTIERGQERRRLSLQNRILVDSLKEKNQELERTLEKLKDMQSKLIESERRAAMNETAVAIKHEIINPLTTLMTKVQLMMEWNSQEIQGNLSECLMIIKSQAERISEIVKKLSLLDIPISTEYVKGIRMLDIKKSCRESANTL